MSLLHNAVCSIQKTWRSFGYAWNGIVLVVVHENNTRIHMLATVAVVAAGFFFELTYLEWTMIVTQISLVWGAEAFNTAIEKVVDFISPEFHPKAGEIKDIAAGAVVFIGIGAATTGLIIFIRKLLPLL